MVRWTLVFILWSWACGVIFAQPSNPLTLLDPFIGTAEHGHTYPGASLPFGMVQLSPDTRLEGWDGCSGYHASDAVVFGFSHTHLSGTGIADYCDILLQPFVGPLQWQSGSAADPDSGYVSKLDKKQERASPGYYRTVLTDGGIEVELTASARVGMHRYTFPAGQVPHVLLDLVHRDEVRDSSLKVVNDREIEGWRRSSSWAKNQQIFFVMQFSRPISRAILSQHDQIKSANSLHGPGLKAALEFIAAPQALLIKVALSAVSIEGARQNLRAELPGWDFEQTKNKAETAWAKELGRVDVQGGTVQQQRIFYTSLYHSFLSPNLYMDVDGQYRGLDGLVHRADGYIHHTVFSLWDTFRANHPLFTILQRKRSSDFINTLLAHHRDGGRLSMWELAANDTHCMIGYHAVSVILDAFVKGISGFDAQIALAAMKHVASLDHFGLAAYRQQGFIPLDAEGESVSKTLEYAYDDWCIADMARRLGQGNDAREFYLRARYYQNLFDPQSGFFRPKQNQAWLEPFDPRQVNFHFTEANAWQYAFYVPQDLSGLIALLGGDGPFLQKLDELFATDSRLSGREQVDITGLIGQYAHGNEPSHHLAYVYNYAGQAHKTQARVRQIMDSLYSDQADGLCGNEDCGQMSAWYVFSALGFYPLTPGQDTYVIGTPLFPKAELNLENGQRFTVLAPEVSRQNIYIQSAKLNGRNHPYSFLRHADIMAGGVLEFAMGPRPNPAWGHRLEHRPVSRIEAPHQCPVPYVKGGQRTFENPFMIQLASADAGATIHYTLDGNQPSLSSPRYEQPLRIEQSCNLKALTVKEGQLPSLIVSAVFKRIQGGRSIRIFSPYNSQYTAGGDEGLIDTLRGGDNFRNGLWQGYQDTDFQAVVDLGRVQKIDRIAAGFLQSMGSWIWLPVKVEFAVSEDGQTFHTVANLTHDIAPDQDGDIVKDFAQSFANLSARYVQVKAQNLGTIPAWHPGRGGQAFIFIDEIIVD